jgi:heme-degrading monooxygenase HmoA
MYMVIRRLKIRPGLFDEAVRLVENELLPLLRSMPGFVEYELLHIGEDEGLTISVFETQEQVEESNKRAAEWVKPRAAQFAAGPYEIVTQGSVRFREVV